MSFDPAEPWRIRIQAEFRVTSIVLVIDAIVEDAASSRVDFTVRTFDVPRAIAAHTLAGGSSGSCIEQVAHKVGIGWQSKRIGRIESRQQFCRCDGGRIRHDRSAIEAHLRRSKDVPLAEALTAFNALQ